jgi:ubiquinone/menaquinone biosynthesis C-methylase UbiE
MIGPFVRANIEQINAARYYISWSSWALMQVQKWHSADGFDRPCLHAATDLQNKTLTVILRARRCPMDNDDGWQLHGSAPELYEQYLVPLITSLWAIDLIERAAPQAGERVLDLACGTGIVARTAAARMGNGRIVGLDINAGMLAIARSAPKSAVPIEWREGSATGMPLRDETFDLILCQLGLQFFPDKPLALREMWRVLAKGGRVALSVFTAIENTTATHALADALDRHIGGGASQTKRSEHVLSDDRELSDLVTEAGFHNVAIETVTQTIRFPSAADYVRLQMTATPLSGLLDGMDDSRRLRTLQAITSDLVATLGIGSPTSELRYPQQVFVLLASK